MARVEFNITMNGTGRTLEEAWDNALEGFVVDPGVCPDEPDEVHCEDCDEQANSIDDLIDGQICQDCHGGAKEG
jgi:hypothetical protein